MIKPIYIFGIHRSGTNYLMNLLNRNFGKIHEKNTNNNYQPRWKHSVVVDELEDYPVFVIYKNVYTWVESILKRKAVTPDRIRRICWKTHAVTYVYNMAKQNATEATQKLQSLSPSTARDVLTLMLKVSLTYIRRECNLEKRYVECASS